MSGAVVRSCPLQPPVLPGCQAREDRASPLRRGCVVEPTERFGRLGCDHHGAEAAGGPPQGVRPLHQVPGERRCPLHLRRARCSHSCGPHFVEGSSRSRAMQSAGCVTNMDPDLFQHGHSDPIQGWGGRPEFECTTLHLARRGESGFLGVTSSEQKHPAGGHSP